MWTIELDHLRYIDAVVARMNSVRYRSMLHIVIKELLCKYYHKISNIYNLIKTIVENGGVLDTVTDIFLKRNIHLVNKDSLTCLQVGKVTKAVFAFKPLATSVAEDVVVQPLLLLLFLKKKSVNGKVLLLFPELRCFFSFFFRTSPAFPLLFRSAMAISFTRTFLCPPLLLCSAQRPMVKSRLSQLFTWMSQISLQNHFPCFTSTFENW